MKFDEENFDKFTVASLHIKSITEKRLEEKILMNCEPFVKFVKIFPRQTFALYGRFPICLPPGHPSSLWLFDTAARIL